MFLKTLNRIFAGKVIVNCERQPYLHRWYLLKTASVSIFLHKFVRSDEDRALHDHPWAFLVIPLWRGYIEHSDVTADKATMCEIDAVPSMELKKLLSGVPVQQWLEIRLPRRRRVWPFIGARYRSSLYRHRVELLANKDGNPLPSWSLFFHFKRTREWGFWPKDGFIQWNKWWQEKCE